MPDAEPTGSPGAGPRFYGVYLFSQGAAWNSFWHQMSEIDAKGIGVLLLLLLLRRRMRCFGCAFPQRPSKFWKPTSPRIPPPYINSIETACDSGRVKLRFSPRITPPYTIPIETACDSGRLKSPFIISIISRFYSISY